MLSNDNAQRSATIYLLSPICMVMWGLMKLWNAAWKRFCLAPKIPYQHSPLVSRIHEESFWILLMEAFVWGAERRTLQREGGCSILLLDIPSSEKRATLFRFDQRTRGNSQLLSSGGRKEKKKKDSCLKIIHLSWDKSFQVWFCFCGLTLSKLGAGMTNNVPVYSLCSSLQEAFVMLYTQITTLRVERTAWMKCLGKKIQRGKAKPLWKCTLVGLVADFIGSPFVWC